MKTMQDRQADGPPIQAFDFRPWTFDRGFTLVELLVVVTIITVLLALLVPAMAAAMYQAKLAVCSAQIDSMAVGKMNYATSHNRRYPYKRPVFTHESWWGVHALRTLPSSDRSQEQQLNARYDYRVQVRDFINIKALVDPMATDIPGLVDPALTPADATVMGTYGHWEGVKYYSTFDDDNGTFGAQQRGQGMMKMGDRLVWVDSSGREVRLNLLVSDMLAYHGGGGWLSGHPDRGATAGLQDRDGQPTIFTPGGKDQYLWSLWFGEATQAVPIHDVNYGFQDGSTLRSAGIGPPPYAQFLNSGDFPLTAVPVYTEDPNFFNPYPQAWVIAGGG